MQQEREGSGKRNHGGGGWALLLFGVLFLAILLLGWLVL